MVVQELRLHAVSVRGPGLILDKRTRSHMLQLRPSTTRLIHIYIYDHCKGDYKITLVPIKSGRNLNLTMLSDGKIWCGPGIPRIEYSGPRKTG